MGSPGSGARIDGGSRRRGDAHRAGVPRIPSRWARPRARREHRRGLPAGGQRGAGCGGLPGAGRRRPASDGGPRHDPPRADVVGSGGRRHGVAQDRCGGVPAGGGDLSGVRGGPGVPGAAAGCAPRASGGRRDAAGPDRRRARGAAGQRGGGPGVGGGPRRADLHRRGSVQHGGADRHRGHPVPRSTPAGRRGGPRRRRQDHPGRGRHHLAQDPRGDRRARPVGQDHAVLRQLHRRGQPVGQRPRAVHGAGAGGPLGAQPRSGPRRWLAAAHVAHRTPRSVLRGHRWLRCAGGDHRGRAGSGGQRRGGADRRADAPGRLPALV